MPNRVIDLANYPTFQAINLLTDPGYDRADHVIPNCVQVVLNWSAPDGKQIHNVLHGQVSGSFAPTQGIANSIMTQITTGATWTAYASQLTTTTTLSGVSLRDLRVADQPIITSSVAGAAGTDVSQALPLEVAFVVTLRTALAGRSARGRVYLAGFGTDLVQPGNVTTAGLLTSSANWVTLIQTALTAQAMTLCLGLPHRLAYVSPAGRSVPERFATTLPVTSIVARDNHWDSQRRRGLK